MSGSFVKEETTYNSNQDNIDCKDVNVHQDIETKYEPPESDWVVVWVKEECDEEIVDNPKSYNNIEQEIQVDIGPYNSHNVHNVLQKSINGVGNEKIEEETEVNAMPVQVQNTEMVAKESERNKDPLKIQEIKANIIYGIELHDTEDNPYQCKHCQTSFSRKSKLLTHIKKHTGDNPYQCDKSSSLNRALKIDVRVRNNGKSYHCSVCDRFFAKISILNTHLRSHSREKPYKCSHCDKSFLYNGSLKKHIFMAHLKEKPFHCTACDKGFVKISHLETHLLTHSKKKPYECSLCEKGYIIRNLITQSGKKPYQCSHCDNAFTDKQNLLIHHKIHTRKKSNNCS